jgi:hypothetical protein
MTQTVKSGIVPLKKVMSQIPRKNKQSFDRGVVYSNLSVCHHLLQISVGYRVAAIPAHAQQDDFGEKMLLLKEMGRCHRFQAKEN